MTWTWGEMDRKIILSYKREGFPPWYQPMHSVCFVYHSSMINFGTKSFIEVLKHLKKKFKSYQLFFSWIIKASFTYIVLENICTFFIS